MSDSYTRYTKPKDIVVDYFGRGGTTSLIAGILDRQGVSFEYDKHGTTTTQRSTVLNNIAPAPKNQPKMSRSDRIVQDTGKNATIAGYLWSQHKKESSHIEQITEFLNLALSKETEAGQMPDSLRQKLTDMASCIAGYFGMDYLAMISQNHEECHDSPLFNAEIKKLKRRMIIQGLDGKELSETEMLSVINKIISMYTPSM